MTLIIGQVIRLTAVGVNAQSQVPPATPVAWTTSNNDVLLNNALPDGSEINATAVAAGSCTITLTDALSQTATLVITVIAATPTSEVIQTGPVQTPAPYFNTGLGIGYSRAPQGSTPF